MNPLPVIRENECLPRCGECCLGDVPVRTSEVDDIFAFVNQHRSLKALGRQLRFWGSDAARCPFLQADKRCFVYEARPSPCRAFGHVGAGCPHEPKGLVRFTKWSAEEARAALEVGDGARVSTMAAVGDLLRRTLKSGKSETYPSLVVGEFVARHLEL